MTVRLSREARETIKLSGVTIAGYVRHFSGVDGEWFGDECGCVDDRCIGYHHDYTDECRCLPAWIADMRRDERRDRVLRDVAWMRRTDATRVFPTGLHAFSREDLVQLRDAFAAAVDEADAQRARWQTSES